MKAASMKPNAYAADCPTRQILDRVGDKWAVLILLLVRDEPMRFNALRRAIEGISQKMLSQVLKCAGARRTDQAPRHRDRAGDGGIFDHAARRDARRPPSIALRDWAESNLKDVLSAQRRYDAQRKSMAALRKRHSRLPPSTSSMRADDLELPGLGQFDFDAKLDLGQHRIEAGIAGGGFQIGGGIAQPVHGGGIEIAGRAARS